MTTITKTATKKQLELANKVRKMLGKPEITLEDVSVHRGVIIVETGTLDVDKLIRKALSL